jgi:hypothetical protein
MTATITITPEEFNEKLIHQIKSLFDGKKISITIQDVTDETEYLLSSPANAARLLAAKKNVESGKNLLYITEDELLDLVNENDNS